MGEFRVEEISCGVCTIVLPLAYAANNGVLESYRVTPLNSHVGGDGVCGSGSESTVTGTVTKTTLFGYTNLVAVTSTLHPSLQNNVDAEN